MSDKPGEEMAKANLMALFHSRGAYVSKSEQLHGNTRSTVSKSYTNG
jgi:hypothetical protein